MSDYLEKLCSQSHINLIYTDNDYTILSSGIKNNAPVLRVNNMFRVCPERIAQSIMGYYTRNDKSCLLEIEEYIDSDMFFLGYEIDPPDEMFLKSTYTSKGRKQSRQAIQEDSTTGLVEVDILSMTKKDFYGNSVKVNPGKALKASTESVAEFDIIIKDSE